MYVPILRRGIDFNLVISPPTNKRLVVVMATRHHTKGSAAMEISLPSIAVKPQRNTQIWSCT